MPAARSLPGLTVGTDDTTVYPASGEIGRSARMPEGSARPDTITPPRLMPMYVTSAATGMSVQMGWPAAYTRNSPDSSGLMVWVISCATSNTGTGQYSPAGHVAEARSELTQPRPVYSSYTVARQYRGRDDCTTMNGVSLNRTGPPSASARPKSTPSWARWERRLEYSRAHSSCTRCQGREKLSQMSLHLGFASAFGRNSADSTITSDKMRPSRRKSQATSGAKAIRCSCQRTCSANTCTRTMSRSAQNR